MVDLAYNPAARDEDKLTAAERFDQIANFYLAACRATGSPHPPTTLYAEKKWTPYGYYSEKDFIELQARELKTPIRFILQGITRGFNYTKAHGEFVRSFRFLIPHISQRVKEGTPL